MTQTVLITGGAGFIGSHCASLLIRHGFKVRALDNLDPQIHGIKRRAPAYLDRRVDLMVGDIRSPRLVRRALADVDTVIHLAARVGVGQSMYQLAGYTDVNAHGTAILLEAIVEHAKRRRLSRLIVASSMSIYGEGLYHTAAGEVAGLVERNARQLRAGFWEPVDANGRALVPQPTPETKPASMGSVYALSKFDQERLCLMIGGAYGIPTVALRFFNVYGPHQALSNPYSGVLAIFATRLLNNRAPLIFEDGEQLRDFVYVDDVAEACRLALESDAAIGHAINVGSGRAVTVNDVARLLADSLGVAIEPKITGECRVGDVRHCFPDLSLARAALRYEAQTTLEQGIGKLVEWLDGRTAIDRVGEAMNALTSRGLTV